MARCRVIQTNDEPRSATRLAATFSAGRRRVRLGRRASGAFEWVFAGTAVSLVGQRQVLQAYAMQPSSISNNKGSNATVSNLTEPFFKAYNANDMQRGRQYVTSAIVYIEMEVETRFVLLSRLSTTQPGDFAF